MSYNITQLSIHPPLHPLLLKAFFLLSGALTSSLDTFKTHSMRSSKDQQGGYKVWLASGF